MTSILIVDDSPTETYKFKALLEKYGYVVLSASDGASGVAKAQEFLPDLVLMDIVMPELNGFQATRKITKNAATKHIPVIIVTTKGQPTDQLWGKRQGATDYLTKPVEESMLIKTIERTLQAPAPTN